MAKAKSESKGTVKGTSKVASKADADKATKAVQSVAYKLGRISANRMVSITFNGVDVANPNSKTPFLQTLRQVAASAGDCKATGKVPPACFSKARAIFAIGGGFTYVNQPEKTLASVKPEVQGYTLHEFEQLVHNPTDAHMAATMAWAKMCWAAKGTATLANGIKRPVAECIARAEKYLVD